MYQSFPAPGKSQESWLERFRTCLQRARWACGQGVFAACRIETLGAVPQHWHIPIRRTARKTSRWSGRVCRSSAPSPHPSPPGISWRGWSPRAGRWGGRNDLVPGSSRSPLSTSDPKPAVPRNPGHATPPPPRFPPEVPPRARPPPVEVRLTRRTSGPGPDGVGPRSVPLLGHVPRPPWPAADGSVARPPPSARDAPGLRGGRDGRGAGGSGTWGPRGSTRLGAGPGREAGSGRAGARERPSSARGEIVSSFGLGPMTSWALGSCRVT